MYLLLLFCFYGHKLVEQRPILRSCWAKKRNISFIAHSVKNGGITGAYRGLYSASEKLGWNVTVHCGEGNIDKLRKLFADAVSQSPDAIVIGGFDLDASFSSHIEQAKRKNIVIVGWHSTATPSFRPVFAFNITTSHKKVSELAVKYLVSSTQKNLGVVISNEQRFSVANEKTKSMVELLKKCERCTLLSIENINIESSESEAPLLIEKLKKIWKALDTLVRRK